MSGEFSVGGWLIEPDLNRASKGAQIVQIEPKVLKVLECLAEHPGEVLSKDKIVRTVWPDTFVSDGILSYCYPELRKAFGDDARSPHLIQTISRKGYRLIAPVTQLIPPQAQAHPSPILPFSDMSSGKGPGVFLRWDRRGDHQQPDAREGLRSHRGRLPLHSRENPRTSADRQEAGRGHGARRERPQSGKPAAHHSPADQVSRRCHLWSERYDRRAEGCVCHPGRDLPEIAATLEITLSPKERDAIGQASHHRSAGLRLLPAREAVFSISIREKALNLPCGCFPRRSSSIPLMHAPTPALPTAAPFCIMYAGSHESIASRPTQPAGKPSSWILESAEAHASRGVALSLKGELRGSGSSVRDRHPAWVRGFLKPITFMPGSLLHGEA